MRRILSALLLLLLAMPAFAGDDREKIANRLEAATTVLDDIMAAPDKGIPSDILGSAKCVAIIPSLLKGGFIVGGTYGKGFATCRTDKGWSAPAPIMARGGSFGFQAGGEAVDYVMVIMNQKGMNALLSNHFKLGADVSAAAGPVGRHTEASTDWKFRAEVLTYSRARGVFAGVALHGTVLNQDKDDTRTLYGRMVRFATLLHGEAVAVPGPAQPFVAAITKYSAGEAKPAAAASKESQPPQPEAQPQPQTPPPAPPAKPPAGTPQEPPPDQPK